MGYAYIAQAAYVDPVDGGGDGVPWPDPWPFPYPPYPPGIDPDPIPPDDPDYPPDDDDNREGTWRFRHIVKSINARRSLRGYGGAGLPTKKIDANIDYDDINGARTAILELATTTGLKYAKDIDGHSISAGVYYVDLTDLLGAAGINWGGHWRQQNAAGTWYAGDTMQATDKMHPSLFYDLEKCLELLTHTEGGSTMTASGAGQGLGDDTYAYSSGPQNSAAEAWTVWAADSGGFHSHGTGLGAVVECNKNASGYYGIITFYPDTIHLDKAITTLSTPISSLTISRKFKLYNYLYPYYDGFGYTGINYDPMNTGYSFTNYTKVHESAASTDSSEADVQWITSYDNDPHNWTHPPGDDATVFQRNNYYHGWGTMKNKAMVEWTFTEDAKLGKWTW